MRKLIGIVTLGLLMAAAPVAEAQKASFWLGAGLTMPMGDYGDGASTGFHGLGAVSFGLGTGPLGVRVEGMYNRTGLEQGVDGNTSILGGMASLLYTFPSKGTVRPYVLGGVGYYQQKIEATVPGFSVDTSESNAGFGGGAGLLLALKATSLFAEVRYISVSGDTFVPITAGIRFGGK